LYDPSEGYYRRRDLTRWGRAGDYRTSPERSRLFAATFARYFAKLYEELCAPSAWTILEAGAGAGHFAAGVLETLKRSDPAVFSATRYVIDEISSDARERARHRLSPFGAQVEYGHLTEIEDPISDLLIFSNELLDALPVHRVRMLDGKLFELGIGLSATGAFCWVELEPSTPRLAIHFERASVPPADGQVVEVNLEAEDWLRRAAAIIKRGYLVTVDYGAEESELFGAPHRRDGTLRAFHRHQFANEILERPGELDLTTTLNWTHIQRVGEELGLQTVRLERQDKFLLREGALDELERMTAQAQSEAEAVILRSSAREMILPAGMGASFQVLVQRKIAGKDHT
ncbi:MAG TPA: SAM-dependent methyltransferase, partial [Pyrinomonadaceae bacterium]|nr:SAM-dependent methyltransferase [Pyrinomonadaceae bacterium]